MKLTVRHTFPCTVAEFWEMFWEPAFDERMQAGTAVRRELLGDREEGQTRIQRFRFIPEKTLPGPIAKIAGTDRITYEQENRFDRAAHVLRWKVIPAILADKVTAQGEFTVRAVPEGCERLVDGVIEVRVPFVGGRIEQAILGDVAQAYEAAAQATRDYLQERRSRA